jgi:hypothetical protein
MPETAPRSLRDNARDNAVAPDEALLEAKMLDADLAGNATLRDAYARRLERLRAGKAAGNVVAIATRRA